MASVFPSDRFAAALGGRRGSPAMQAARDRAELLAFAQTAPGRLGGVLAARLACAVLEQAHQFGRCGVELLAVPGFDVPSALTFRPLPFSASAERLRELVIWRVSDAAGVALAAHLRLRAGIPALPELDEAGEPVGGPVTHHGSFVTVAGGKPARVTVMRVPLAVLGSERIHLGFELPDLAALGFYGAR